MIQTSGPATKCQRAPPSAVAASSAGHAWEGVQPTPPSTTPEAAERKLAEAGWKPAGTSAACPGAAEPVAAAAPAPLAPAGPHATSAPTAATAPTTRMKCVRIGQSPFRPARPVRRWPRTGGDHAAVPLPHPPLLVTTPGAARGCTPNGRPGRDLCPAGHQPQPPAVPAALPGTRGKQDPAASRHRHPLSPARWDGS